MNCSVSGCRKLAEYEVIFYDFYVKSGEPFYMRHDTCPFLCADHVRENELRAKVIGKPETEGARTYRSAMDYPHTKSDGQGFVIYSPLVRSGR